MEAPVRLCCGERHISKPCPDGKVMCALCFYRFDLWDLHNEGNKLVDVCRPCAEKDGR